MSNSSLNDRTCPNCGGKLIVDDESLIIECDSCGTVFGSLKQEKGFVDIQYGSTGEVSSIMVNSQNPMGTVNKIITEAKDKVERDRAYADAKAKEENKRSATVVIVCGTLLILLLIGSFLMAIFGDDLEGNSHDDKVRMPCASKEFIGDNYADVIKVLKNAGFTNVNAVPLGDLVLGWVYKDGEFSEIIIDGDNSKFEQGTYYKSSAEIVVKYHSYPEDESTESRDEEGKTAEPNDEKGESTKPSGEESELTEVELKPATDSPEVVIERYNSNNPPVKITKITTEDHYGIKETTVEYGEYQIEFGEADGWPDYELTSSMPNNEENTKLFLEESKRFLFALYPGLTEKQADSIIKRFSEGEKHITDLVPKGYISFEVREEPFHGYYYSLLVWDNPSA